MGGEVEEVRPEEVVTPSAYLLFYERQDRHPATFLPKSFGNLVDQLRQGRSEPCASEGGHKSPSFSDTAEVGATASASTISFFRGISFSGSSPDIDSNMAARLVHLVDEMHLRQHASRAESEAPRSGQLFPVEQISWPTGMMMMKVLRQSQQHAGRTDEVEGVAKVDDSLSSPPARVNLHSVATRGALADSLDQKAQMRLLIEEKASTLPMRTLARRPSGKDLAPSQTAGLTSFSSLSTSLHSSIPEEVDGKAKAAKVRAKPPQTLLDLQENTMILHNEKVDDSLLSYAQRRTEAN
ncbi:unnamed protein product [Protopolystoma xenopodis]|uniref:Uncharacterized protein n=1 Tax=Protopolystoma xenopodis TaxID=117903 RepID=A0A3S4ZNB3_9PLAT|nr:unnamed protein product [Protopolystoma xenopodis]